MSVYYYYVIRLLDKLIFSGAAGAPYLQTSGKQGDISRYRRPISARHRMLYLRQALPVEYHVMPSPGSDWLDCQYHVTF